MWGSVRDSRECFQPDTMSPYSTPSPSKSDRVKLILIIPPPECQHVGRETQMKSRTTQTSWYAMRTSTTPMGPDDRNRLKGSSLSHQTRRARRL